MQRAQAAQPEAGGIQRSRARTRLALVVSLRFARPCWAIACASRGRSRRRRAHTAVPVCGFLHPTGEFRATAGLERVFHNLERGRSRSLNARSANPKPPAPCRQVDAGSDGSRRARGLARQAQWAQTRDARDPARAGDPVSATSGPARPPSKRAAIEVGDALASAEWRCDPSIRQGSAHRRGHWGRWRPRRIVRVSHWSSPACRGGHAPQVRVHRTGREVPVPDGWARYSRGHVPGATCIVGDSR